MHDPSLGIILNANTNPHPNHPRGPLNVPVLARLHWYRTGEEWAPAMAVENSPEFIRVVLDDGRRADTEIWLLPEDVRRR